MKEKQILCIDFYGKNLFVTEDSNIEKQVIIDSILALKEVETNFQLNRVLMYIEEMYNRKKLDLDEYNMLKEHVFSLQLKEIKVEWTWYDLFNVAFGVLFLIASFFSNTYLSIFISYLLLLLVYKERFNRRMKYTYEQKIKEYQYLMK